MTIYDLNHGQITQSPKIPGFDLIGSLGGPLEISSWHSVFGIDGSFYISVWCVPNPYKHRWKALDSKENTKSSKVYLLTSLIYLKTTHIIENYYFNL